VTLVITGVLSYGCAMTDSGPQDAKHRTLLGRLAWRAGLDEPLATDALAVLLEEPAIRVAVLNDLEARFRPRYPDIDLRRVVDVLPRMFDGVHGSPDIVGCDDQGRPILVIEAKFDSPLRREQAISYLQLQERDTKGEPFAFVLLMPKYRVKAASDVGRDAAHELGMNEGVVLTVSWQEILDVVEAAAATLQSGTRSYGADAEQLRDLVEYRTHAGLEPPTSTNTDDIWDTSLPFYVIVNPATRRLDEIRGTKRYLRQGIDSSGFGPFHYVAEPVGLLYALGPHRAFASHGLGPLWVRIGGSPRADGRDIDGVRSRLARHGGWVLRDDWGYVWVPIDIEGLRDEDLVDGVVDQVQDILRVGLPSSLGLDEEPIGAP